MPTVAICNLQPLFRKTFELHYRTQIVVSTAAFLCMSVTKEQETVICGQSF